VQSLAVVSTGNRRLCEQVLQWTRDWGRARELAHRVAVIFAEEVAKVGLDVHFTLVVFAFAQCSSPSCPVGSSAG
jgi:hypothetical protein